MCANLGVLIISLISCLDFSGKDNGPDNTPLPVNEDIRCLVTTKVCYSQQR